MSDPASLNFGYLTTTGRVTGRPHRIEIWFSLHEGTVYLLSGGRDRSDWVRNVIADQRVTFELGRETRVTTARMVHAESEEDALVRRLLVAKYSSRDPDDLGEWGRTALPVAIAWDSETSSFQ